jgi:hypothetical protein
MRHAGQRPNSPQTTHAGVKAQVDDRFWVAGLCLPEGRLDVGLEHLEPTGSTVKIEELRIVRTTDLGLVRSDGSG